ncbi:Protein of unknown function [Lactobacillus helveticus CIRM-BIA 104]|uniref:Uncharacterized protein n=1 Tax=Lactobacillus helveticus CIRM-BIA 104 TaxID=1226333 RepID=U6FGR3_LACHE|nr:Protein of unknown function [Lactobacillus helveticus CIRM-BIA 104]
MKNVTLPPWIVPTK